MKKIGEFANLFNISIKTVRFYEEKELFKPFYIIKFFKPYGLSDEMLSIPNSVKRMGFKVGFMNFGMTVIALIFVFVFVLISFFSSAYISLNREAYYKKHREYNNEQSLIVNDLLRVPVIVRNDLDIIQTYLQRHFNK